MQHFSLFISFFLVTHLLVAQVPQAELLGTWSDSTLVGSDTYDNAYNEIWGYAANGKEYAVIGSTRGTHFIDVTDPRNPVHLFVIDGGTTGGSIIHRDYHDYNGFLYGVADEGRNSTLQVMDLSSLPDSVSVVYDSKEFINRTHNMFIDTSSAIMYSCISNGDDVEFSPLRLFDISDPADPQIISDFFSINGRSFTQVHDAFVRNDTAYLNCGPRGFVIAEFSDPANPQLLATLASDEYPQAGYNHSGWLSEDGKTYFMADENWGMDIKVLDVTALPDLTVIDTIDAGSPNNLSIPHNQVVDGNLLYVSYYYDGLQVYDISDPNDIERVLHYPTSSLPHQDSYEGAWGVYPFLPSGNILVSDMQEGLFIVENPRLTSGSEVDPLKEVWNVFPNPSNGNFDIQIDKEIAVRNIELIDADGKFIGLVERKNSLYLNPGQYYLKLNAEGHTSIKSLIIVR